MTDKLLKFVLNDGSGEDRVILSGIKPNLMIYFGHDLQKSRSCLFLVAVLHIF